jgi:type IV pilus assembly protein PilX
MMKMREKMHNRQQGIVLIVSLLILLVLSIIGISAISNTGMEERMSSNFQQEMVAFQASESAITKTIDAGNPGGAGANSNPFYVEASDPLVTAVNAGVGATTTTVTHDMDPLNTTPATVQTTATISYQGSSQLCPGYGVGISCLKFEVSTDTSIGGTGTGPSHVQGVERPAPGT